MDYKNNRGNNRDMDRENNLRQKLKSRYKREKNLNLLAINIDEILLTAEAKAKETAKIGEPTDGSYWSIVHHAFLVQQKLRRIETAFRPQENLDSTSEDDSDDDDDSDNSEVRAAKTDSFAKGTTLNVKKHGLEYSKEKNSYVKPRYIAAVVKNHLSEGDKKCYERAAQYFRLRHENFVSSLPQRIKNTLMSIDNKTLKFFNKLTSYQQTNFIYNYIKKTVFTRRTVKIIEQHFNRVKQLPTQSPAEYLGHLEKTRKLLVSHNKKVQDVDIIDRLLDGLEPKYRLMLSHFYTEHRTLEEYRKHLNDLEQMFDATNSNKRKRDDSRSRNSTSDQQAKRPRQNTITCFHCNQAGHKVHDCPLRKKEEASKRRTTNAVKIAGVVEEDGESDGDEVQKDPEGIDAVIAALHATNDEEDELNYPGDHVVQETFSDSD